MTYIPFHAELEYDTAPGSITRDQLDELIDALDLHDAAVSYSLAGRLGILVTVPAHDLASAARLATQQVGLIVEHHLAVPAAALVRLEVTTEGEFDARDVTPGEVPALVSPEQAAELLGVTRQRVLQMVSEGKFRTAQRVGDRTTVLARAEVEARATTDE